jgi:Fe-S-cluster containining protein
MEVATLHQTRLALGFYDVPCNGCTRCCHSDAVRILPHEDASKWLTEPHPYMPGARMLAHKANGDCHYLGAAGCTIQHDKPQMCHEMDCRTIAQELTASQARMLDARGGMPIAIWHRGRELLKAAA